MDRCPICEVSVKSENLLRHLNEIHPRHPDTPALQEKLKREPGRIRRTKGPPIRIRRWQILLVGVIVVGGFGAYYLVQAASTPPPFPCISQEGGVLYHWHANLEILSGSTPITIPAGIGLSPLCTEPLHTHAADGRIHIESDVDHIYTLGDFFLVWRKPFGSPNLMHLNGTLATPSPNVPLYDTTVIQLHYDFFSP